MQCGAELNGVKVVAHVGHALFDLNGFPDGFRSAAAAVNLACATLRMAALPSHDGVLVGEQDHVSTKL